MPKLPSIKTRNPVGISSFTSARTGNTTALEPKNLTQFGGALAKIGGDILKFKAVQLAQERKIFEATQETKIRSRLAGAFINAPDESQGADPSGGDTIDRYVVEFSKLNKEINSVSDKNIKQSLLNKANNLASGHVARLNTTSISKRNIFNANAHEVDLNKKLQTIAADPEISTLISELNSVSDNVNRFFGFNSNKDIEKVIRADKNKIFDSFLKGTLVSAMNKNVAARSPILEKAKQLVMSPEFTEQFGSDLDRYGFLSKIESFELGQLTKEYNRLRIPHSIYKKNNRIAFERLEEGFLDTLNKADGNRTVLDNIRNSIEFLPVDSKNKEKLRKLLTSKKNSFSKAQETAILNRLINPDTDLSLLKETVRIDDKLSPQAKFRLLQKAKTLLKVKAKSSIKYKASLKSIQKHFSGEIVSDRNTSLERRARSIFISIVTDPDLKGLLQRDIVDIAVVQASGDPRKYLIKNVDAQTIEGLESSKQILIDRFQNLLRSGRSVSRVVISEYNNVIKQINIKKNLIESQKSFDILFKNLTPVLKEKINETGGN
jgi:hypothetical protein